MAKVVIGLDFDPLGTVEATGNKGITITPVKEEHGGAIQTLLHTMRGPDDEMNDEEFVKSLPHRLHSRVWANPVDEDAAQQDDDASD